jgi:DNA-binding NarL/FixJ family response regulator
MGPDLIGSLTRREIEVLWLLDARLSNAEIAEVLHTSPGTVKEHTSRIDLKLLIHKQREAIAHGGDSPDDLPP